MIEIFGDFNGQRRVSPMLSLQPSVTYPAPGRLHSIATCSPTLRPAHMGGAHAIITTPATSQPLPLSLPSLFFSPESQRAPLGQVPDSNGPAGAPAGWIPAAAPPGELLRAASPRTRCGGISPWSACQIPGGLEVKWLVSPRAPLGGSRRSWASLGEQRHLVAASSRAGERQHWERRAHPQGATAQGQCQNFTFSKSFYLNLCFQKFML
jgi:hypothetical protein